MPQPMPKQRDILVTNALPYANGPIHLGHMVGYVQADVWVRFQRARGHQVHYVCADDAHGTGIMLNAEKKGITPEQHIAAIQVEHERDFADFGVAFDNYHSTHSEENRELAELIYTRLKDNGLIAKRGITQLFDPEKNLFLADRYVKGGCPKCKAPDQYGDNCEKCSFTYSATDLIDPVSVLSGAKPILKESDHFFVQLADYTDYLKEWTRTEGRLPTAIANKLSEWLEAGLQDWDISRDGPYFGFQIPGEDNKYFYVWLDAPIGYMASFKQYCEKTGIDFDAYWNTDSEKELVHFIGKDIVNFHALFWPVMLSNSGFRTPTQIAVNGFLTVNKEKMSKSRGTFIEARTYLDQLDGDYLRYYYAAKLSNTVDDLDLNLSDFVQRVNTDLVNKLVNIASRTAKFINKAGNKLSATNPKPELWNTVVERSSVIAAYYDSREYNKAMREVMELADLVNEYIAEQEPWAMIKREGEEQQALDVCSLGLNCFHALSIYLKPVVPNLAARAAAFLNSDLSWPENIDYLGEHEIQKFKPLLQRITEDQVNAIVEASKESLGGPSDDSPLAKEPLAEEITFDDFAKVDLRVAKIVKAEHVEGADKLLQLTLDIGGVNRNVFSGIKSAYKPEDLEGKLTIVVANLKPRKMKFGLSEGMVLAAGPGGKDIYLLEPHDGAEPGMRVM